MWGLSLPEVTMVKAESNAVDGLLVAEDEIEAVLEWKHESKTI